MVQLLLYIMVPAFLIAHLVLYAVILTCLTRSIKLIIIVYSDSLLAFRKVQLLLYILYTIMVYGTWMIEYGILYHALSSVEQCFDYQAAKLWNILPFLANSNNFHKLSSKYILLQLADWHLLYLILFHFIFILFLGLFNISGHLSYYYLF